MARALLTNGARKVYILGRRLEHLQTFAATHPVPNVLIPIQCDVTSKSSLQSAVDTITAQTGYLNLLVVNSGTGGTPNAYSPTSSISELKKKLFIDHDMDAFTDAFRVNVTGAFFSMVAFLELLDAGNRHDGYGGPVVGGGAGHEAQTVQSQIVVTSSIAAFIRGPMTGPSYGGSKAAIMQIAKQASSQLGRYGIRVNALAPGCRFPFSPFFPLAFTVVGKGCWFADFSTVFPSELAAGMIAGRKPEEEEPDDPKFIPARKFGGDEEMAGMILYLASRAGSFCNGLMLVADGGRLGQMQASY